MGSERFLRAIETRGKNLIIRASENQLGIDQKADEVNKVSYYGSSHIFEIALRLIGENDLADEFKVDNYEINDLVVKCNQSPSCLHAAISHMDAGRKDLATKIMNEHKSRYHVSGIGFLDPHNLTMMEDLEKEKKIITDLLADGSLLEYITLMNRHIDPMTQEKNSKVARAYVRASLQLRFGENFSGLVKGFVLNSNFKASVPEAVYSMLMNHMLGNNEEADRLYLESRYFQEKFYAKIDPFPLRALALIDYPTAQESHKRNMDKNHFFRNNDSMAAYRADSISNEIFHLDQFGEEEIAFIGRKRLYALSKKLETEMLERETANRFSSKITIDYGNDTFRQDRCLVAGMALVGLGKSHAKYFF